MIRLRLSSLAFAGTLLFSSGCCMGWCESGPFPRVRAFFQGASPGMMMTSAPVAGYAPAPVSGYAPTMAGFPGMAMPQQSECGCANADAGMHGLQGLPVSLGHPGIQGEFAGPELGFPSGANCAVPLTGGPMVGGPMMGSPQMITSPPMMSSPPITSVPSSSPPVINAVPSIQSPPPAPSAPNLPKIINGTSSSAVPNPWNPNVLKGNL